MSNQQDMGDPALPSRAHEQSPLAVSALRVSPAIAGAPPSLVHYETAPYGDIVKLSFAIKVF